MSTNLRRRTLDTGARRGELADLRLTDLDFDLDVALVLGKGRRERALPFGRTTAVALDRFYIENWSLGLDLYILLKTFGAVAGGKGAF